MNNKKPEAVKLPTFCYSLILASTDGYSIPAKLLRIASKII